MDGDDFFEKARSFFPRAKDWPPMDQRKTIHTYEEFLEFSSQGKKSIEALSKNITPKKEPIEGKASESAQSS